MTAAAIDPRKVAEEICELAGLTPAQIGTLPKASQFVDVRGKLWKVGETVPGMVELHIFLIFAAGEDVLVYTSPLAEKNAKGEPLTFVRFTLNRRAASLLVEQMALETWKEEIADEFIDLWEASADEDDEDEDADVPEAPEAAAQAAEPPPAPSAPQAVTT